MILPSCLLSQGDRPSRRNGFYRAFDIGIGVIRLAGNLACRIKPSKDALPVMFAIKTDNASGFIDDRLP
ncbi:hypothetical protein [Caballeronia sp. DA-9]|uniref:hypothetical protein n=1 Tax=Caballeronia sp. DA-9 TaxID=3436237 RepID=UPI003F6677E9